MTIFLFHDTQVLVICLRSFNITHIYLHCLLSCHENLNQYVMMARNYCKISGYFCQVVRSSSQGFVTTSYTKSTMLSVRMMKPSQQSVHDEAFSRLHALFRSFKTNFKRTFIRINNTYFHYHLTL